MKFSTICFIMDNNVPLKNSDRQFLSDILGEYTGTWSALSCQYNPPPRINASNYRERVVHSTRFYAGIDRLRGRFVV